MAYKLYKIMQKSLNINTYKCFLMQVNLSFDTEKDSVEDFRKLLEYIRQILAEKEGKPSVTEANPKPQQDNNPGFRTAGGGRITPYQDLSNQLFSLCSKRK